MILLKLNGLYIDVDSVLDWELSKNTLPQPRGTLNICLNSDASTTKIIQDWHERVNKVLKKRGLSITV